MTVTAKVAMIKSTDYYEGAYILLFNFHIILDITCWNPAFDVTPAHLIRGIITEVGVLTPPLNTEETLRLLLS